MFIFNFEKKLPFYIIFDGILFFDRIRQQRPVQEKQDQVQANGYRVGNDQQEMHH